MALPQPEPHATALVTGASSGIGRAFARELAARGLGVTLVARREERLERLAEELRARHGVSVGVIPTDLAGPGQRGGLVGEPEQRGLTGKVLVNNARFGISPPFAQAGLARAPGQAELLYSAVMDL